MTLRGFCSAQRLQYRFAATGTRRVEDETSLVQLALANGVEQETIRFAHVEIAVGQPQSLRRWRWARPNRFGIDFDPVAVPGDAAPASSATKPNAAISIHENLAVAGGENLARVFQRQLDDRLG